MKRCLALAAALALLLCACAPAAQDAPESALPNPPVVSSAPEPAPEPTPPTEETRPQLDYAAEPPLDEYALAAAVPDFLTEEQQLLYRRAFAIFDAFEGMTENIEAFPLADGTPYVWTPATETLTIEGPTYIRARGRYRWYQDFEQTGLQLFTPEYFEELRRWGFLNIDGYLYYIDAAKGSNHGYVPEEMPDAFELVSQTEDAITFNLIGHYYVDGYQQGVQRTQYTTASFPIRMVRQGGQWRFAEFHIAGMAETYDRMSEVKTWGGDAAGQQSG